MSIDRRALLGAMGGLAASRALGLSTPNSAGESISAPALPPSPRVAVMPTTEATFPRTDDFVIGPDVTFLNAAYTHPVPKVAVQAAQRDAHHGRPTSARTRASRM